MQGENDGGATMTQSVWRWVMKRWLLLAGVSVVLVGLLLTQVLSSGSGPSPKERAFVIDRQFSNEVYREIADHMDSPDTLERGECENLFGYAIPSEGFWITEEEFNAGEEEGGGIACWASFSRSYAPSLSFHSETISRVTAPIEVTLEPNSCFQAEVNVFDVDAEFEGMAVSSGAKSAGVPFGTYKRCWQGKG